MTDSQKAVSSQNPRETGRFRCGEAKGRRFIDLPVFITEGGQAPVPNKKGLAVAPQLWPVFRKALAQVDAALVQAGWPDRRTWPLKESNP